jgi:hypothetical protein
MAIQKINNYGVTDLPEEYTCESDEIETLPTDVPTHSTCWVLDTKVGLMFDGTSWREV